MAEDCHQPLLTKGELRQNSIKKTKKSIKKMNIYEVTILEFLKKRIKTKKELAKLKRKIAKRYRVSLPSNIDLLKTYRNLVIEKNIKIAATAPPNHPLKRKDFKIANLLENLLKTRPVRSLSGIVSVSVLTKSYPCPGKCIFCPTEKGLPKSYLSGEPAVERAKILKFDPYLQVQKRIEMLKNQGHFVDKVELRIIGGSFTFYQKKYKTWFLKKCFDGANETNSKGKTQKAKNLKEAQKINEIAKHRIVGISIETRPDLITEKEIKNLRELGVTMVELGVQTIFDNILEYSQTGQKITDTIKATKLLKDSGFKVMYQMMPNLPKSTVRKDKKTFKEIFENQNFKPDWLKIYPCVVLKEAKLHELWKEGKYRSYSDKKLISLIKYIKSICPYWIRITRIYRDIARQKIISGSKISNLREVIQKEMKEEKITCHCIRCREVKGKYSPKEKVYFFRINYKSSEGKEIFLSFENKKRTKLYSFLRLRIVEDRPLPIFPILKNAAIIREIHTFGQLHPLGRLGRGRTSTFSPQHKGFGRKLIREAEKITKKEFSLNKIAIISGIGARNYFLELGYKLKETYMIKDLT